MAYQWKPYTYHPVQQALWNTKARFCVVVAARQMGKTDISLRHIILEAYRTPGIYLIVFPTERQAHDVVWHRIQDMLSAPKLAARIVKMYKQSHTIVIRVGKKTSEIRLRSAENGSRLEGGQYKGIVIDESSDLDLKTVLENILPGMSQVPNSWMWITGIPKSSGIGGPTYKEIYERWQKESETDGNYGAFFWNDYFPEEDMRKFMQSSLSAKALRTHALAEWSSLGLTVFKGFDTQKHCATIQYNPSLPVLAGCTFVQSYFTIEFAQEKNGSFYFFDEIREEEKNIRDIIGEVRKRYGQCTVHFFGDAAGRARANSDISDYALLQDARGFKDKKVIFPKKEITEATRMDAINELLESDPPKFIIDPHKCKYLVKDMMQVMWGENRELEKRIEDLNHASDAASYIVCMHDVSHGSDTPLSVLPPHSTRAEAHTDHPIFDGRIIGGVILHA